MELDYTAFDRQVENLMAMSRVFATEVNDCGVQEMMFDLVSLQAKSARLCMMVDIDYALQQTEIAHVRAEKNVEYHERFEELMNKYLSPMILRVVGDDIKGKNIMLPQYRSASPNLATFLPQLKGLVDADGDKDLLTTLDSIDDKVAMLVKNLKPTAFPGMKPAEKFWRMFLYYLQMCYLMYHFRRTSKMCEQIIEPEEVGRLLTAATQNYALSEEGSKELELFWARLTYNCNKSQPTVDEIKAAQKALLDDVPHSLQLNFIKHLNDIDKLGRSLSEEQLNSNDVDELVKVMAKSQMLTQRIDMLQNPKPVERTLPNEVFHDSVNGKPLDFRILKESIGRMTTKLSKKNQWVCVWCILKHHNLLQNTQLEPFARQMMDKKWFGNITEELRIKGDTLRDYAGYFTMYDYTRWNLPEFRTYCEVHHKTKWSPTLFTKLQRTCYDMEALFENDSDEQE